MPKLRTVINHPWTAARVLKANLLRPFVEPPEEMINILEKDWDNLIILDACRFDTFKKYNTMEGKLSKIYSTASQTAEFARRNIKREYSDTIYISASPQLVGYEQCFYEIEHLWRDQWDDDLNTVPPQSVTERATQISSSNPDKRLVIHYMQPHYPFIGEKGDEIGGHATFVGDVENRETPAVWDLMVSGKVDAELVKAAYEENLELVLPYVEELVPELDGKTVVSSDHGNLFGKKSTFLPLEIEGHPRNFHDPELLAVPWFELPYSRRKETTEGNIPEQDVDSELSNVEDRLQDLGYLS